MRHRTAGTPPLALLFAGVLSACCLCHQTISGPSVVGSGASGTLRAGVAVVDFTPPSLTPLAGYGGKTRRYFTLSTTPSNLIALGGTCIPHLPTAKTFFEPATGTHDPIRARALVLDNGVRKIAIVKLDTIGVSRKLRDDLFAVAHPLGITSAADLVVVATHTHSGPGTISDQPLFQVLGTDCFAQNTYDQLLASATSALQNANAALQPARLGIGTTTVTGANKNRSYVGGPADTELALVKITTPSDVPIAALFNFSVHGTSFGASSMTFSADCMGAMESVAESKVPGAVAIFTNAAEGDVAPMYTDAPGVVKEGDIVGGAVGTLWPTITTKSSVDIRTALQDVAMPTPSFHDASACIPLSGSNNDLCSALGVAPPMLPLQPQWVPTTLPFQALRIDDTVFLSIPGEPITQIGLNLKSAALGAGFTRGVILGLANDHGGYFTTPAEYLTTSYESKSTIYGPTTGTVVEQSAGTVMNLVK